MTHHKLIHAASERVLSDAKTLLEEHVQDEGKGARGRALSVASVVGGLSRETQQPQGLIFLCWNQVCALESESSSRLEKPDMNSVPHAVSTQSQGPQSCCGLYLGDGKAQPWVALDGSEDVLNMHVHRVAPSLLRGGACGEKLGFLCHSKRGFICEIPLCGLFWKD